MSTVLWLVILYFVFKRMWKKHKTGGIAHPRLEKLFNAIEQASASKPKKSPPPAHKPATSSITLAAPKQHPSTQIKKKAEKQFEQL